MSDPMTPEVRDWMKRTDLEPPDAHKSAREVRARLPGVKQRRRWWPFPVFYREPETSPTEHPTSIPATNGHTPTITGRTRSMLSPVKAITAGALVFAIGGAFLIAQPFQQPSTVPGAEGETTEPRPPAIVTGNMISWGEVTQEATETMVDGVDQRRGGVREGARFEMDDPRLTGTVSYMSNLDGRKVGRTDAVLVALGWRIENEEGSWSGTCPSVEFVEPGADPSKMEPIIFSCFYTGAGAYEGLSAYLVQGWYPELPYPIKGLIFEGDMPPYPELPPAE